MIFILSIAEKASGLMFCSRLKIYVSMVLTLAFVFKIIRPIIFSAVKKVSFPQKEIFLDQGNFPHSWNFSFIKKFFHCQGMFLQSNSFSTVKEFFHNKGISPQSKKFSLIKEFLHIQRSFPWSRNFSTVKKFFYRQLIFLQSSFPKKKIYLINEIFYKQGSFPQNFFLWSRKFSRNKYSYTIKNFFCKQWSKRFLKTKIVDPFNTKYYVKTFLIH